MTTQDALLKVILPYFEAQQRQGQDGRCLLSLEARVSQLKDQLSTLELGEAVENLSLDDSTERKSELEQQVGTLLVQLIDISIAIDSRSDMQEPLSSVMALIAAFAMSYSTAVADMVISRAIEYSTVLLERIRGHSCILLGTIAYTLAEMQGKKDSGKDEWIEMNLWLVIEALMPRLQDKGQAVRFHAIKAAGNFFSAMEKLEAYEEMLDAMLWSVAHDPSVSNRVMAVQSVPVNSKTLDVIVARVRDVKPKVRAEALYALSSKSEAVTEMTEQQLVDLIQSGFTSRCALTKTAASKMVCAGWMKAVKYDPIALVRLVGPIENEEQAKTVLKAVFEAARSEENELLEELSDPEIRAFKNGIEEATVPLKKNQDRIDVEHLFFLRCRCQNVSDSRDLTSSQKDNITSKLIPEIPILCETFEKHANALMAAIREGDEEKQDSENFICLQLLQFAKLADIDEEGSRRHFSFVMKQMLSSVKTPDDLLEGCIQALRLTYDNETDFSNCICEIINDISDGKEESGVGRENLGTMVLVRILSILSVVLETATSNISNSTEVRKFAKYIVPSVTHKDALIREAAVGCFGKLGLFIEENTVLDEFKPILMAVAGQEDERTEIRAQALLALSDWSMLFSDVLKPITAGNKSISLSDIIFDMMTDSKTGAVCIAAEVAAKLLFAGRVCDSEWIAQLLAIFFNPRMVDLMEREDDIKEVGSPVRLQQLLTIFFPAYSMRDELGRDALMGSILPMLDIIFCRPTQSKKTKKKVTWPIGKMIQYVCAMVDKGKAVSGNAIVAQTDKAERGYDAGKDAAFESGISPEAMDSKSTSLLACMQVAEFLSKSSQDLSVVTLRALCKFLGGSTIGTQEEEQKNIVALKRDLEELGMLITDATCLRSLSSINDILAHIEVDYDDDADPSEDEDDEVEQEPTEEEEEILDLGEQVHPIIQDNVNLSNELVIALNGIKITDDDDVGMAGNHAKENNGKSGNKGRKHNSGSNASRRSRLEQLSDTSAN